MTNPGVKNLIPIRSKAKARKLGAKGGVKSGQVRREKRLLSQIYAEVLANSHNLDGEGKSLNDVVSELILQGNVPMIKEIREATEGQKVELSNPDGTLRTEGIKVEFIVNNNSNECPIT